MCPGQAANTSVRRSRLAFGSDAKWRASSTNAAPPFSSTNPWPSVCVLKMIVSLLRPGSTAVIAWVGDFLRDAERVMRVRGLPAASARSFRPVSRSTYSAGRGSKPCVNGRPC